MPSGEHFKGKKPENSGRKKGSVNKVTAEIRSIYADILDKSTSRIQELLDDPETKPDIVVEIWKVAGKKIVPDLSATTINPDADGNAQPIQLVVPALDKVDHNGNPLT